MSRRLLLAAGGSSVVTPPDDPDDPGTPPTGWPTTSDPILLALRPTGARVLATRTATPGAAIGTELSVLVDQMTAVQDTSYGADGPEDSCVLFLPPGTYQGGFGTGKWTSIVGTTGNPEDVVIFSDTASADGVIHPFAPLYVEGVTLKAGTSATQSPKYCAHIGGSPRVTFANVKMDATEASPAKGNAGTVGMDGSAGTVLTFYGGTFLTPTGSSGVGMNLHAGDPGVEPSRVSFINCTAANGVAYAGTTSTEGERDELYVIGGSIGDAILGDSNVSVFTNLANAVTGAASTTRGHTTWPLPANGAKGLAEPWASYFTPSIITNTGTTVVRANVTDVAPMTPVLNRTYYCPVPIPSAMLVNRIGVWVRSGTGQYAINGTRAPLTAIYYPSDTLTTGFGLFPPGTLPSGQILTNPVYPYVMYPAAPFGGNRFWVGVKFTSGSPTIDGSAELPGLETCYYSDDDGATLVQASAGTPFPLAHVAQVR